MSAFDVIETVDVHKDVSGTPSTAKLTLNRRSDGSVQFVADDGNDVVIYSTADDAAKRLFETIDSLV